jgi:hypothetical protein
MAGNGARMTTSNAERVRKHRAQARDKGRVRIDITLSSTDDVVQWNRALFDYGTPAKAMSAIFAQARDADPLAGDKVVAAVAALVRRVEAASASEPRPTSPQKGRRKAD